MAKKTNLLKLNGKLTDDEWAWLERWACWNNEVYSGDLLKRFTPLIIKRTPLTREEMLFLDAKEVLKRGKASEATPTRFQAETSLLKKIKDILDGKEPVRIEREAD